MLRYGCSLRYTHSKTPAHMFDNLPVFQAEDPELASLQLMLDEIEDEKNHPENYLITRPKTSSEREVNRRFEVIVRSAINRILQEKADAKVSKETAKTTAVQKHTAKATAVRKQTAKATAVRKQKQEAAEVRKQKQKAAEVRKQKQEAAEVRKQKAAELRKQKQEAAEVCKQKAAELRKQRAEVRKQKAEAVEIRKREAEVAEGNIKSKRQKK